MEKEAVRKISAMLRRLVLGYSFDENEAENDPILGELDADFETVISPPRKRIVISRPCTHKAKDDVHIYLLRSQARWFEKIKKQFGIPCNYFIKTIMGDLWKIRDVIDEELEDCETEEDVRRVLKRHVVIQ